jgi:hypothetical protein
MSNLDARYRVNERDAIAESIDGELLVINLQSGAYYSSDGTGEQIWSCLARQLTLRDTVERLCAVYGAAESEVREAVVSFVGQLRDEELILEDASPQPAAAAEEALSPRGAFTTPVLHKYTDMQELLLLDPIHEVDPSAGWPVARPSE